MKSDMGKPRMSSAADLNSESKEAATPDQWERGVVRMKCVARTEEKETWGRKKADC